MAAQLTAALDRVRTEAETYPDDQLDEWISNEDVTKGSRSRAKHRPTLGTLKKSLEAEFLAPPASFNQQWLNKLQGRFELAIDYTNICELAPTQSRTVTRFTREGLEGRVTGCKEVTVPASSATAKNSTSILRTPANRADFVRGAAGFFPFTPGGLDGVDATDSIDAIEQQAQLEGREELTTKTSSLDRVINIGGQGGLLEVAPGFSRGLNLGDRARQRSREAVEDVERALENDDLEKAVLSKGKKDNVVSEILPKTCTISSEDTSEHEQDLEALLPIEFPALEPRTRLRESSTKTGGREWAHIVDINKGMDNFHELVPEMAKSWPFELDVFQKEAVYHLENGDSVFVAAHTSAGKTVVAEYAIALAAKHMTKAIYTSPIKALSNQKFRDFRSVFDDVGILTGDVQISPEASCLIMTTEILRSMLYRGADLIRDVEFVIFDEVHYINDLERGVVWEEVIIMLPEHVTLILLSATVPNTYEFASWVGRTKKIDIFVISTPKRPIPLEHYLWAGKEMYKIVDSEKRFLEKGWKNANDAFSGRDKVKAQQAADTSAPQRGGGFQAQGGRAQNNRGAPNNRGHQDRGGGQQRGRGQVANRGHGNIARSGRGGGRTSAAQDRNIWVHLVSQLRKDNLLPCCIFVFSKKRCEENADSLSNQDFCTATEKSSIHMTVEQSIARLKPEDRVLPQIRRLRELLGRGIAVHHGGLLPIIKEIVEILFAKTLVKVLFATETFAMGLNLPTRTVIFSGYRKHDGREFRNLLPGEYTQMAGRAGRRGLDTVGSVIIVASGKTEAPPAGELRQMILGNATKLRSQFRLTYNMILNLLRVEALKIEEMIKRSFSENATQALLPQHAKRMELSEANLNKIRRTPCEFCDKDLEACHAAAMNFRKLTVDLHMSLLSSPVGKRLWSARRLVVFQQETGRTMGVLLRDGLVGGSQPHLVVLRICTLEAKRGASDLLPYLPRFRSLFSNLPESSEEIGSAICKINLDDVECLTATTFKVDVAAILKTDVSQKDLAESEIVTGYRDWTSEQWDEIDWNKVKDLRARETLIERRKIAETAQGGYCLQCPDFLQHFAMQHDEWLVKENISELKQLMSDQNLQLLPDYEQRIGVLKELGFIDQESRVQLKGKVACEIHSADELVLTELILENVLAGFEPEEIVALLSAFVFQEKTDIEPTLTPTLEKGKQTIVAISEKVSHYQILYQVILSSDDANDFVSCPRFGLMEVVYEWARGMSFNRITDLTDVMEGTIVRVITRLDETCREVKSAAKLVGDPALYTKMQQAQELIKRDVIFAASLYM